MAKLPRHNGGRASTFTTNRTPRSQRYSQRISNQTKNNHNSISTSPIPLPQTTVISFLSNPTHTNQLATLSQDKPAKRARQTQDTLPGTTRKRTRSQTESQQHTSLTQIQDTIAFDSQLAAQPTEQPTNSQPNNCTTRSQITCHDYHATQAIILKITPPTQQINIINPITYQVHNNPIFEFADHPAPSLQRRPQRTSGGKHRKRC
jgi:hypothetical protein